MRFSAFTLTVLAFIVLALSGSVVADERRDLEEKANSLSARAAEMAERGKETEADNLLRESKELLRKLRELNSNDEESPELKESKADVQHLKERLEELRSALKSAEAGEASDRERDELRVQMAQTERKLMQVLKRTEGRDIPEEFRAQVEKLENANRRLRHLRVASENLKAAEMHDLAHDLMQKADEMEREIHAAREKLAVAMSAGSEGPGREMSSEIRQLRLENMQLKEQLKMLQKAVEELQKQPEESSPE